MLYMIYIDMREYRNVYQFKLYKNFSKWLIGMKKFTMNKGWLNKGWFKKKI